MERSCWLIHNTGILSNSFHPTSPSERTFIPPTKTPVKYTISPLLYMVPIIGTRWLQRWRRRPRPRISPVTWTCLHTRHARWCIFLHRIVLWWNTMLAPIMFTSLHFASGVTCLHGSIPTLSPVSIQAAFQSSKGTHFTAPPTAAHCVWHSASEGVLEFEECLFSIKSKSVVSA